MRPNELKISMYATALLNKVEAGKKIDKRILKYLIYDRKLKGFLHSQANSPRENKSLAKSFLSVDSSHDNRKDSFPHANHHHHNPLFESIDSLAPSRTNVDTREHLSTFGQMARFESELDSAHRVGSLRPKIVVGTA